MRAGEPLVLHWMSENLVGDGLRRAACGASSVAWRCVDGADVTAAECSGCAAVAAGT